MKRIRVGAGIGYCLILNAAGCQWISGLDDLYLERKAEESTGQGAGGAGGGMSAGGGGTGGSSLQSGVGGIGFNDCTLLDLPNQAPTNCSNDTQQSVNVTYLNQCDLGEALHVYQIGSDLGDGTCGMGVFHLTLQAGTAAQDVTSIGNRFRIWDVSNTRVMKDDIEITMDGQIITIP